MATQDVEDIYELSPMQQGMLFHTLYAPHSGVYFEQSSLPIKGVKVAAFERAWQDVINRHPILRTSFYWDSLEKPLQVVHRNSKLFMDQQDWSGLPAATQKARLASYLQAERFRGFDLSSAPLLRLSLLRLNDDIYQFVLNFHHILLDGWSKDLLVKEVFTLYEAYCWGRDLKLERSRPYSEYIAWLQRQDASQSETFWRRELEGFSSPTRLAVAQFSGRDSGDEEFGETETRLSQSVTNSLQAFARRYQLTLNTIAQGAWGIVLSRYSGEAQVLFGTIVSGRPPQLAGVESMVGLFINAVPVPLRVFPQSTVLAYLQTLQTQLAKMRQYEYSSLVEIQAWSEVPSGMPLFESLLVFENYPGSGAPNPSNSNSPDYDNSYFERTNYPLTVMIAPNEKLWLKMLYSKRHFDADLIQQMLQHYGRLLEQLSVEPQRKLSELEFITGTERSQPLNTHAVSTPTTASISLVHELFETQAARTPDAAAVICGSEHLTYGELDRRSDGLADYLRELGVKPESAIGVCLPRSLRMVTAVLGILKAGGAYVPLDLSYPEERLASMIQNANVQLVITDGEPLSNDLRRRVQVIQADKIGSADGRKADHERIRETGENLAYILHTSGSTGMPKAVGMTHRALANLIGWQLDNFTRTAGVRVLQFAPLSFDVSFQEIFSTWCSGGTLVLISEEERRDSFKLIRLLQEQSIQRLFLPFVALQQLAEASEAQGIVVADLQQVITAGEQLQISSTIGDFFRKHRGCTLHNQYGPTEAHVVTSYTLTGAPDEWPSLPPIGRPIGNTQTYLVNRQFQLVPAGVAGELYLGGVGLARGYLNSADLTAERFVPHPFSTERGARLYRTGDLARYRPDGQLEFLGRTDQQVKLRGYRIELGEIETALTRHNAVAEAVVDARADGTAYKRLVAYIVAHAGQQVSSIELRNHLNDILPEYMIPAVFVQMQELPLTSSGKIDRRLLPAPEQDTLREYVEPQTEVQQILAQMWMEVLEVEKVSVNDNFFEVGGHSLLAMQVISRVRDTFQIEFPLKQIFEAPALCDLAESIEDMLIADISDGESYLQVEPGADALVNVNDD